MRAVPAAPVLRGRRRDPGTSPGAAELVHVAQPSLSQQIRALERELGADLFRRARGNITLTDAGEALLPLARRILADTDTARHEVQEVAQLRSGRVRLGATPSLCTGLLPDVLRAFPRPLPGRPAADRGGRLARPGTGAGPRRPRPRPGGPAAADALPRAHHGGTAARGPGGRLLPGRPAAGAGRRAVRIADLEGERLVMFRHGYDLRELTVAACRAEGFEPGFAVEGGEMDAVLGFARAGLGVAVVPRMVAGAVGARAAGDSAGAAGAVPGPSRWPTAVMWLRLGPRGSCSGCCWSADAGGRVGVSSPPPPLPFPPVPGGFAPRTPVRSSPRPCRPVPLQGTGVPWW
ncbi:hypothetical protein GCM10023238_00330 [Streptomyces heliomycini]